VWQVPLSLKTNATRTIIKTGVITIILSRDKVTEIVTITTGIIMTKTERDSTQRLK